MMRAHGIDDDEKDQMDEEDEEDQASDWESDKEGGRISVSNPPGPGNKCMYSLRTNPNRLKSCRVCENCGKEFLSWKSFLEHGKCTTTTLEDIGDNGVPMRSSGCGWSKRKRSFGAMVGNFISNCPSSEEEDLANCLMMLSNAAVDPLVADQQEESCASASKDQDRLIRSPNNLSLVAPLKYYRRASPTSDKAKGVANKGLFECKTCKKVFNSHQALGGHRASHKKVKGCFAARLDHGLDDSLGGDEDAIIHDDEFVPTKSTSNFQLDHDSLMDSNSKKRSNVHECSICHRVFSTGQALGGHKRCHWITSNTTTPHPSTSSSMAMTNKLHHLQHHLDQIQLRPNFNNNNYYASNSDPLDLTLDLNLPATAEGQAKDHPPAGPSTNPSCLEVSTEIFLQAWMGVDGKDNRDNHQQQNKEDNNSNNNNCTSPIRNVEDEEENKIKLAKLSELKDLNIKGVSSPWLQVGLGSTSDVGVDP